MDTNIKAGDPLQPVETQANADHIEAHLGLWDAVSIIVGIIIGVGIFWTPPDIFKQVPHPAVAIAMWVLGGALALIGAFCFAELASAYPRSGGEYVYLTKAFGPLTGYLFAWSQLAVTRPGSVAGMAYIFGSTAAATFGFEGAAEFLFAALAVLGLSAVNIVGVRMGTRTQNILTAAKVLGLVALIVVGFGWGSGEGVRMRPATSTQEMWFLGGMIFVLWTYSGWHEAAYIVAEAKNHTRNIPLALILGTAIVTVIYVLINLAYLYGLGFEAAKHDHIADRLLDLAWPRYGGRIMNVLIMISSLGAINGMIFTTARIFSEFGRDHRVFKALSHWSKTMKTPVKALVVQCALCLVMIAGVWYIGNAVDNFERTVKLTVAVFWAFFCLTGVALIRLRETDPETPRPFRVIGYPVLPIIFSGWCAYIVVGTIIRDYQRGDMETWIGLGIVVAGLPFYFLPQKLRRTHAEQDLHVVAK